MINVFNFDDEYGDNGLYDEIDEDMYEDYYPGSELPDKWDNDEQKELQDKYGIHNYRDFAETCGDMIYADEDLIPWEDFGDTIQLESGVLESADDLYQIFIISDPDFAIRHTYEPVFYDSKRDIYLLGVTHFGTMWMGVPAPQLR